MTTTPTTPTLTDKDQDGVVTAVKDAQTGWMPLQDGIVALSTVSVHLVLPNATHAALTEDKTNAAISSQAVLDDVAAVGSARPTHGVAVHEQEGPAARLYGRRR
jgi:hypothetical protein